LHPRKIRFILMLLTFICMGHPLFAQNIELLSQLVNGGSSVSTLEDDILFFDSGNKVVISSVYFPGTPDVMGSFLLDATILDMDIENNFLSVLDANGYFNLFNVTDPEAVVFQDSIYLGEVFFDPIFDEYAAQVISHENMVFILREDQGLTVIDISQPTSCEIIGSYGSQGPYNYRSMAISANHMLLGVGGSAWDDFFLETIDITDPANPLPVGSVSLSDAPEGVTVSGNTAFVAAAMQGLVSINVSDMSSPTVLDTSYWDGWYTEVVVAGDYAYVACDASGMNIIDISDPASMDDTPVGIYHPEGEFTLCTDIGIDGEYVFLATGGTGLHIIDISSATEPTFVASGSPSSGGGAFGVDYKDDYVFIADYQNDLTIVDVADPYNPFIVRNVGFEGIGLKVEIFEDLAYVSGTYGLHIVDISNPLEAHIVGEYLHGRYGYAVWAHGVDVQGDICYLSYTRRGLYILDVSDPANIIELSHYAPEDNAINDVQIVDSLAYLVFRSNGGVYPDPDLPYMEVLNISDPTNPQLVGSWTGSVEWAWGNSLIVRDSIAYMLDNEGLFILDVSDPTEISQLGVWDPGGWNFKLSDSGDLLFIAKENGGMKVVDVSDPTNPNRVANFHTIDWCADVAINDSLVYIADYDGGLLIAQHDFLTVAIDEGKKRTIPETFSLEQNYPNPFNPTTTIAYNIPYRSETKLTIHDIVWSQTNSVHLI